MATATETKIPPVVNEHEIPAGAKCQEASRMPSNKYIPCSAPASSIVFSPRDRRSYYMCDVCASHAVQNRGFELRFAQEIPQERKSELAKQAPFTISPITYPAQAEAIQKLADEYLPLTVTSVDDKAGIAVVHEARMKVRNLRLAIESRRKELKASALEYGREVDTAARKLCELLDPIETHLLKEESIVAREKARLAAEAEQRAKEAAEKHQAVVRERLTMLKDCGAVYMAEDIADLPQDEFDALLSAHRADKKARDEHKAAAEAECTRIATEQKAEAERLEKLEAELEIKRVEAESRSKRMQARMELLARQGYAHTLTGDELADMPAASWESLLDGARKEKAARDKAAADQQAALDKQRAEQEEEREKINAEKNRLRNELCQKRIETVLEIGIPFGHLINTTTCGEGKTVGDMPQAQFDGIVAKLREERDEIEREKKADAIAEQERVAAAEKAHAEAAAAEQRRMDALRPDHEKLLAYADAIAAVPVPEVSYHATSAASEAEATVGECVAVIRGICSDMIKAT